MQNRPFIKRGIVAFWAIWFAIVFATNLCDGAKTFGALSADWMFASGNYEFMLKVTGRYPMIQSMTPLLFAGVVLWELVATILFWRAVVIPWSNRSQSRAAIHLAFAAGLALCAAFVIADEILISYDLEAAHLRLFSSQLVSLMFLELVPNNEHQRPSPPVSYLKTEH